MTSPLKQIRNLIALSVCLIAAGFVALSIHVAMLAAGVPFPSTRPPIWARWIAQSVSVASVLAFLALALPRLRHLDYLRRTLLTFVLLAALKETLRGAIMNGVVTTGWLFSATTLIQPLVRALIVAALCVFAMRWARSGIRLIAIALVVGAISVGASMLSGIVLAPLTARFAALSRPDLYEFPYPLQVMIPAYLTFLEPVIATVVMAAMTWPRLPAGRMSRVASFAALVATTTGMAGPPSMASPRRRPSPRRC
jgi:hypothetical protein